MSKFLTTARHHAERIEYYFRHAGSAGYSQARYHEDELIGLLRRASDSNRGKNDVPVIQAIIKDIRPMMDEMLNSEKEA